MIIIIRESKTDFKRKRIISPEKAEHRRNTFSLKVYVFRNLLIVPIRVGVDGVEDGLNSFQVNKIDAGLFIRVKTVPYPFLFLFLI